MNIFSFKTTAKRLRKLQRSCLFLILIPFGAVQGQGLPALDSIRGMLISEDAIKWECTEAIQRMYNYDFRYAESIYAYLRRSYPEHPISYFLMGLSQWWRMAPNIETRTEYDAKFLAYTDSAIVYGEAILDTASEGSLRSLEAAFFLAAAHGFQGRLFSERKQWTKAALAGKKALKYLQMAEGYDDLSPELLFGTGLYNYFSIWIPENYKYLKPILWFFKKGDKALGIEQLETVSTHAFYARTEAQVFLMKIYDQERQMPQAYTIGKQLMEQYPNNPYIHRQYARLLYQTGRSHELEQVSRRLLAAVDSGRYGYEALSGRYASFYLGSLYRNVYKDTTQAKLFLERSVDFSEKLGAYDMAYYWFSLAYLGELAEQADDYDRAKAFFEKVKKHADRKHPTYAQAQAFLKQKKKKRRK